MLLSPLFPASDLVIDRAARTDPRSEHLLLLSMFMKSEIRKLQPLRSCQRQDQKREMTIVALVSSLEENKTSTQERGNEKTAHEGKSSCSLRKRRRGSIKESIEREELTRTQNREEVLQKIRWVLQGPPPPSGQTFEEDFTLKSVLQEIWRNSTFLNDALQKQTLFQQIQAGVKQAEAVLAISASLLRGNDALGPLSSALPAHSHGVSSDPPEENKVT